jgi:beta-phosphoglucomutase-like phosphatase (HAD superfamily)
VTDTQPAQPAGSRPAADGAGIVPGAVLWDMDGTLVDTEPYWIAEEYELVAEYGGSWSDEDAHSLVGNDLIVSANYIREHGGVPLSPEAIIERLLDRVIERVRVHSKPHPEPYLTAAARLGLPVSRCVAIEDSLTGVQSAQAAGVPVLAVEHLVPIPPMPGRTVVRTLQDWTTQDLAALLAG